MSHETQIDQAEKLARARKALADAQLAEEKVRRANGETGSAKFFASLGLVILSFSVLPALAAVAFPPAALMALAFFATGIAMIKKAWDVSPAVQVRATRSGNRVDDEQVVFDQPQKESDIYAQYDGCTGSEMVPMDQASDEEIDHLQHQLDRQLDKIQKDLAS